MTKPKKALISVYNKEGIVEFAKGLHDLGIEIISTGGTAALLKKNKIPVTFVEDYTGFPEILDNRVKTLHPKIHAGILAVRSNKEHMEQLKKLKFEPIDIVVVNLYPLESVIHKRNVKLDEVIKNIDIGGPTMIRAAAKNFQDVIPVIDPRDYNEILELLNKGDVPFEKRMLLAAKVAENTARHDSLIQNYFFDNIPGYTFPEIMNLSLKKIRDLRYGENPFQKAAFYSCGRVTETCVTKSKQLHGKELSFNNILDIDAAFELIKEFDEPTATIVKHTNPCGVASRPKIEDAFKEAHEADTTAAFGGIISLNRKCNLATARLIKPLFAECIIAPSFDKDALDLLKEKKNLRILETGNLFKEHHAWSMKKVTEGMLIQTKVYPEINEKILKTVSNKKPTKKEIEDMLFAWKINAHVKSNSIVFVKGKVAVGIGAGQMARVDAVKIACFKAGERAKGAVMASDAFFPFRDGIDVAAKAGVTAVIQPGGSIRDQEVIDAVNEHNMSMVFTGFRIFLH
ncbi:MAG: bifunctional phosphoribosylaminoimidazolecarboxamide formyltransferase/IMP cyclohydrolase [Candidatus Woesearchaeota archaeon]